MVLGFVTTSLRSLQLVVVYNLYFLLPQAFVLLLSNVLQSVAELHAKIPDKLSANAQGSRQA